MKRFALMLFAVLLITGTALASPDIRYAAGRDVTLLTISPPWPGGHGALSRNEVVEVLGAGTERGTVRIHFFAPTGQAIPAQVAENRLSPQRAGDPPRIAIVNNPDPADRLHMRLAPRSDSLSRGRYYNGTVLTVLQLRRDGWAQVDLRGYKGWMKAEFLQLGQLPGSVTPMHPVAAVKSASAQGSMLKELPNTGSNFGRYPDHTAVFILGVTGGWAHVYAPDGLTGFMPLKELDVPGGLRP